MLRSVLSVLLLGMLPISTAPQEHPSFLADFSIAAPSFLSGDIGTMLASRPVLTASGMVIIDLSSGQRLYGSGDGVRRPMASLTKLMTALLIAEEHDLRELVRVPADIRDVEGRVAYLPPGEHFSTGDLLKALLIHSSNDAAVTLARFHSGSESAFVTEMNRRAMELGLRDTTFANATGFDDDAQLSTARDIAWLAAYVLRNSDLRRRLSTQSAVIESVEGTSISLIQTHELLQATGAVVAGKTGTTDAAKECLMSVVKRGGREYVVVLLSSRERYEDMRVVLDILAALVA